MSVYTSVSEAQMREDLELLSSHTDNIRTYSVDGPLGKIPYLAEEFGLRVTLGIWISPDLARNEREMLEQGRALLALGSGAVLMKGGHLDDAESPDWLFTREGEQRFTAPRVQTKNTHGTGCTLSAALAALRPRHADWAATVIEAKAWLSAALAQADSLEVGHGIGPVHHFHAWW